MPSGQRIDWRFTAALALATVLPHVPGDGEQVADARSDEEVAA